SRRYQSAEEVLQVISQYSADTTEARPNVIPDSLVTAARRRYDIESEKAQVRKLEKDRKQELNQKFDYGFREILEVLDSMVNELNQIIQVEPIERMASPEQLQATALHYRYFGKYLIIEALPLIDVISRMDHQQMGKIEEKGLIGAASLYLAGGGETRRGINFILMLEQGKMYGSWKTCEIRDHALIKSQHRDQPSAIHDAEQLLRDLSMHWNGIMDIHTVSIKDFSKEDFVPFL
ncbi:unnamed protein product, partial [marine sediment metagenome]